MMGVELLADTARAGPFRAARGGQRPSGPALSRRARDLSGRRLRRRRDGDSMMFAPPFVMTEEQLREADAILDAALTDVDL